MTGEEKLAVVHRYNSGRETAKVLAEELGVGIATVRSWARNERLGLPLRSHGGAREHCHGFDEEDIRRFVHFKNQGWKMEDIAEKLERCRLTTYKIQRVAKARGLIDETRARKRGERR